MSATVSSSCRSFDCRFTCSAERVLTVPFASSEVCGMPHVALVERDFLRLAVVTRVDLGVQRHRALLGLRRRQLSVRGRIGRTTHVLDAARPVASA